MSQKDRRTAKTVLNIAMGVMDPSRMLQRVPLQCRNKRQSRKFNEFASCSVCEGSGPCKNSIAIRSSSRAPHRRKNVGRAPKKLKKKKPRKEEKTTENAKDHRRAEKSGKEGQ